MNKFPWVSYIVTLLFYAAIAVLVIIVVGLLPKPQMVQMTPEQQQQYVEQQKNNQIQAIASQILARVSNLMTLPVGVPDISVINDATSFIANNPVFAGAVNGDVILSYPDRIIVYSMQTNKIINSVYIPASARPKPAPQAAPQNNIQKAGDVNTPQSAPVVENQNDKSLKTN